MAQPKRDVDLLQLLRKGQNGKQQTGSGSGLYIVKVITAKPEATLMFEGTQLPLDVDIFEVPIRLTPLEEGAKYFALPIINADSTRWGLLEKISGGEEASGSFTTTDGKTVTVTNGIVKKL